MNIVDLAEKDILQLEYSYNCIKYKDIIKSNIIGKTYEFYSYKELDKTKEIIYTPDLLYGNFVASTNNIEFYRTEELYKIISTCAYYPHKLSFYGKVYGISYNQYLVDLSSLEYTEKSKEFLINRKKFLIEELLKEHD